MLTLGQFNWVFFRYYSNVLTKIQLKNLWKVLLITQICPRWKLLEVIIENPWIEYDITTGHIMIACNIVWRAWNIFYNCQNEYSIDFLKTMLKVMIGTSKKICIENAQIFCKVHLKFSSEKCNVSMQNQKTLKTSMYPGLGHAHIAKYFFKLICKWMTKHFQRF